MAGTKVGGKKAAKTNILKFGEDFYKNIGRKGGQKLGVRKGFALMSAEQRKECGRKGGSISRRGKVKNEAQE